ncbi:MAG: rod-binding protein [Alphaproteobacteria bacterium]
MSSINILSPDTAFTTMQAAQTQSPSEVLKSYKDSPQAKNTQRMKETAQDFEAVFLSEMIKPMFEGLETDGPFNGGKGEEIFRGMMITEFGKEIASQNVTGIQTQVMDQLIKMQAERTANNQSPAVESGKIIDLDIIEE